MGKSKKNAITAAEKAAGNLLRAAETQAKKGEPRLIAEIFRFLRPNKPIILQVRPPKHRRQRSASSSPTNPPKL